MEDKFYYLSVDKWNLMESLVTESISPYSFYKKRNFSNTLSRIKDEGNKKYSQLLLCTSKKGNNCLIGIHESLLDKDSLKGILKKDKKGYYQEYFSYNKTIYFKKGFVKFLFKNDTDINEIVAESRIVFELKCIDKYKDFFLVDNSISNIPKNWNPFNTEPPTFEEDSFIAFDNKYNFIKAAIIGYARGLLTSSSSDEQGLKSAIIKLKNDFTGLHTDIMVNNINIANPKKYETDIKLCKSLFCKLRNIETNYFDMLLQIFSQLKFLANKRFLDIMTMNDESYIRKLYTEKEDIINEINTIEHENNIDDIRHELDEIKAQEVRNGEILGKSREYYKKGTPERERKDYLKRVIKNFEENNHRYAELQEQLKSVKNKIIIKETNSTKYDNTITSVFNRISDIMNDLLKKIDKSQSFSTINLSDIIVTDNTLAIRSDNTLEILYFNIVLNYILNGNLPRPISDSTIIDIITVTGQKFSELEEANGDSGKAILATLRDFWKYKNNKLQSFKLPDNMPIFNSIMSFYIKPFGFDQIERYMMNRHYTQKQYAFMLWGACKGYADLPKTFTNILYENSASNEVDQFLFDKFLRKYS